MNRSHVTLPQILVAASTRHANMVPESAGYLVLALCEAIGCLPLAVPDTNIELSADGGVSVTQQGKVLPAAEAAQAMRELFARLLAVTTGATPRLAAVARTRELSAERGVDTFAAEVEAALVPMNRAAGKRSLGRLARETLRAIESGTLALHLQARTAAKEAPAAVTAAVAPLLVTPVAKPPPAPIPMPPLPLTPPPSLLGTHSDSFPFEIPVTPTTPGLGLDTVATEAHVDSGIFGATPTCPQGDAMAVEAALSPDASTAPPVESSNTTAVSCEPTQLSAREVHIDPSLRVPRSDQEPKAISTQRRVRRVETPRSAQEITLASAGVEPIVDAGIETPAPSSPDQLPIEIVTAKPEFGECHDGQTQSAPKYNETLVGLAPVTPAPSAPESLEAAEALHSSEYVLVTPSALPQAVVPNSAIAEDDGNTALHEALTQESNHQEEVVSSRHLMTEPPTAAMLAQEPSKEDLQESPEAFRALDVPSDEPGRVDELLGTFGRPEEGEEEMLRKTASSLKELAGIEPTPCAPSVSPAIRVPLMTKRATPAWLPEDPRQTPTLEPAPLVRSSRGLRAKLAVPFALLIALAAGFAVVHWRLPEVVLRWIHPVQAKQPNANPPQAAAEQEVYVEP